MSMEPTEPPLLSFDELKNKINSLQEKLLILERTIKIKKQVYDPIDPQEKIALARLEELLQMLNILERGEEEIMRNIIHEMKYITHIIGSSPCRVCGENYHPYEYYIKYYCLSCNTMYFEYKTADKNEIEAIKKHLENPKYRVTIKGKTYHPPFCPKCVAKHVKLPTGEIGAIHKTLDKDEGIVIKQYYSYPKGYLLVDLECEKCGFKAPPQAYPAESERDIEPLAKKHYEKYIHSTCPRCKITLVPKEKFIYSDEINEDIRFKYNLPYPKKGKPVKVPKEAGVKERYYMQIYELVEPFDTGRIVLEGMSKIYLKDILDSYERHLHDREILVKLHKILMDFIYNLRYLLYEHRVQVLASPEKTTVVDGKMIMEIVELANEIRGRMDWILEGYIPEIPKKNESIGRAYDEFVEALVTMEDWLEKMSVSTDTGGEVTYRLELNIYDLIDTVARMRVKLSNLKGQVEQLKSIILDTLYKSRRQLELEASIKRLLSAVGERPGKITVRSTQPVRDRVIALLGSNPEKIYSLNEIMAELNIKYSKKNREKLTEIMNKLRSYGLIEKVAKDQYRWGGSL